MKHLIVPKLGDPDDARRWGFSELDWNRRDCAVLSASDNQAPSCNPVLHHGARFNESCIVIINTNADSLSHFDRGLRRFAEKVLATKDEWCIWWHAGESNILEQSGTHIINQWADKLNRLALCLEGLKDIDPFLYSEGAEAGEWDRVVKSAVRDAATRGRAEGIEGAIRELDGYAKQAREKYYGFSELKDFLAELFPIYLDLQSMLQGDKQAVTEQWKRVKAVLRRLDDRWLKQSDDGAFWLHTLYRQSISEEDSPSSRHLPKQSDVEAALKYLIGLKSGRAISKEQQLAKVHCLKSLFQLLRASRDFS